MTIWLGVAVYLLVHGLGVWLLQASGTWDTLFGAATARRGDVGDPLAEAPRGWIENHTFWRLSEPETPASDEAFWGDREAL